MAISRHMLNRDSHRCRGSFIGYRVLGNSSLVAEKDDGAIARQTRFYSVSGWWQSGFGVVFLIGFMLIESLEESIPSDRAAVGVLSPSASRDL